MYHIRGLDCGLAFGVHNNNLRNMLRGIRERVYAVVEGGELVPPPRPEPGFVEQQLKAEAEALDRMAFSTTPMSPQEFVELYEGRRRQVYQNALDSLAGLPVSRADADSCSFLKAEKIPFYAKADPAPRMIHPRSPRYNVALGRYIRRIEHRVYRALDKLWGGTTVMKGYNARQVAGHLRGMWDTFRDPIAIGLDASRFDQHVSVPMLEWEHKRYLAWFHGGDRRELAELLRWQLSTKCRGRADDGTVKYRVDGMRFSGDMNTGLGNCTIMCALVHAWCRIRGVKARLANNGDDCVLVLERNQASQLDESGMTAWFRRMGFTLKVESRATVFERISFCQASPVFNGLGWVMCRQHGHAMSKDTTSLKPFDSKRTFDRWRATVAEGGLALSSGIPVQQEFYTALGRGASGKLSDPTLESGMMRLAEGLEAKARPVTPESRFSYWLAFGVTPDEQEALEGWLRGRSLEYLPPVLEGAYVAPPESRLFMIGIPADG